MSQEKFEAIKDRMIKSIEAGLDVETATAIAMNQIADLKKEMHRSKYEHTLQDCINAALEEMGLSIRM